MSGRDGVRRLSASSSVVILMAGLAAGAGLLFTIVLRDLGRVPGTPVEVSFLVLTGMFAVSEVLVVHLERRGEAQTVTFSEIPMVAALALASPVHLLLGRLIGAGFALRILRRQSLLKFSFNTALLAFESCLAVVVYRAVLGSADPIEPLGWAAAVVALGAAYVCSTVAVTAVISLYSGWPGATHIRKVAMVGGFACVANACIGLGVIGALYQDVRLAVLVGIIAFVLFAVSRSHMALVQRYASLETLQEFTRTVGRSVDLASIAGAVLAAGRELLRAENAQLLLLDAGRGRALLFSDNGESRTSETLDLAGAQEELSQVLPSGRRRSSTSRVAFRNGWPACR